jgi:hypothetical protein
MEPTTAVADKAEVIPFWAVWRRSWSFPLFVWLLTLAASRDRLFTAPTLAEGHVPSVPMFSDSFAQGGLWHFGSMLMASVSLSYLLTCVPTRRWKTPLAALLAVVSFVAIAGNAAWEGPIFFLDLAAAFGHWILPLEDGDAGRLLSANGFWIAAGMVALCWAGWRARQRRETAGENTVPTLQAVAMAVVGISALLLREPGRSGSPFADGHSEFLLFPAALSFALLAIGGGLRDHRQTEGSERGALAKYVAILGLIWASLVLLFPSTAVDTVSFPLIDAFDRLGSSRPSQVLSGLTLIFLGLVVLVGWWEQWFHPARTKPGIVAARFGLGLIVFHHLLAPFTAETVVAGDILSSWLVAAVLLLIVNWSVRAIDEEDTGQRSEGVTSGVFTPRWDAVLVTVGLGLYVALKLHAAGPSNTDENIYFYMAQRLAEGEWPYRDYFFAHPPLHVVFPGIIFSVFGFSLTLAKLLTALVGGVTAWVVWRIGTEHLGRWSGLVAFVAVLFAAEFLKATSHMTGVNLTTMWLVLGVWQALRGRGVWAGTFLGFAACTGFYAMAPICAILVLLLFKSLKLGTRQVMAFVLVAGAVNLAGYALGGDRFLDGVYRYHGLKKAQNGRMVPLFGHPDGLKEDAQQSIRLNRKGDLELFNLDGDEPLISFDAVPGRVNKMALNSRGDRLILGTAGGRIAAFNTLTGALVWRSRGVGSRVSTRSIMPSRDGLRVYSGGTDGVIRLWDLEEGQLLQNLVGHRGAVTSLALSTDGQTLVSGTSHGEMGVWDVSRGVSFDPTPAPHGGAVSTQRIERIIRVSGAIMSVALNQEKGWVLSSSTLEGVVLRDLATGKGVQHFAHPQLSPTVAVFGTSFEHVYVGTGTGHIAMFDTGSGEELVRGVVHQGPVRQIRLMSDVGTVLSRGDDMTLRMWNQGQPQHSRLMASDVRLSAVGRVEWPEFPESLSHNVEAMVTSAPFERTVYYHPHLWVAFLLTPFLGLLLFLTGGAGRSSWWRFVDPRRFFEDQDGLAAVIWLVALALVLEFAMFRELHSFYFTLILPFLGLLLGYVVGRPLQRLWECRRHGTRGALATAILAFSVLSIWPSCMLSAGERFPSERIRAGEVKTYDWRLAAVAPHFSGLVKDLFWEESRITGHHARGVSHYLWTKKRLFRSLDDVSTWIQDHSRADETIAGASTSTPLVALASKRRVAAGEVDTNSKRFKAELLEEESYWNAICSDNVRFLISTNRSYFSPGKLRSLPVVNRYFRPVKAFFDPELRYGGRFPLCVYERIPGQGPCQWTTERVPSPRRKPGFCPVE